MPQDLPAKRCVAALLDLPPRGGAASGFVEPLAADVRDIGCTIDLIRQSFLKGRK